MTESIMLIVGMGVLGVLAVIAIATHYSLKINTDEGNSPSDEDLDTPMTRDQREEEDLFLTLRPTKKYVNVTQFLNKTEGGAWIYNRRTMQWDCDDGRYCSKVSTGGYDINGEPLPGFGYFVYPEARRVYPR